jgi:hypothetical protein
MERLKIEGSDDTPAVLLDKASGIFEISGRSLPEDTVTFYKPVIEWIGLYAQQPNAKTDFAFKLDYFNTASSKVILDFIASLKTIRGLRVIWYYREDDEEILDAGEEFAEQVEVPFEFKPY